MEKIYRDLYYYMRYWLIKHKIYTRCSIYALWDKKNLTYIQVMLCMRQWCHIPNSETCLRHVWLQYDIKSLWLFGFICAPNSISGLVLYNGLNFIKSPWLFCIIVRRSSHWGGSLQNGLEGKWTCETTLASAYVLRHLSAVWSQLQMMRVSTDWCIAVEYQRLS